MNCPKGVVILMNLIIDMSMNGMLRKIEHRERGGSCARTVIAKMPTITIATIDPLIETILYIAL